MGPVDIEHLSQNNAVDRVAGSDQPAKIVAQPGKPGCWLDRPTRREYIKPGRHKPATAVAEFLNPAVGGIEARPEGLFIVHKIGQPENDGAFGKPRRCIHEAAKCLHRHDAVDGRDQRGYARQPIGHELKADVGGRCSAHDQIEIEPVRVAIEPLPAIGTLLVDDDADPADACGAKAIQRMGDQGPPGHLDQRLAHLPAIGAQAPALARGDDAAGLDGTRLIAGYVRISANSPKRVTTGWSSGALAASACLTFAGAIQTKPMPMRRAPSRSRRKESPTNSVVSGPAPSGPRAA